MTEPQAFRTNVDNLLQSIDLCFRNRFVFSGLALLYSAIDIMSWLSLPNDRDDSTRGDFIDWVEKYLLPKATLNCSALDLYAARCSIIHSYSAESKLSRDQKAQQISYTIGNKDPKHLQQDLDVVSYQSTVVHIDTLFIALKHAIQDFRSQIASDPELAKRVFGRSETKFFTAMP